MPLVRPAIATVAILNGVFVWNDFLLPLVIETKSSLYTLPVAIVSFFGTYSTSYGLVFASVILASAPMILVYVLLNRLFVEGITAGAIK
jgi:raffinose/stachyose/melibiose transport system permease protein